MKSTLVLKIGILILALVALSSVYSKRITKNYRQGRDLKRLRIAKVSCSIRCVIGISKPELYAKKGDDFEDYAAGFLCTCTNIITKSLKCYESSEIGELITFYHRAHDSDGKGQWCSWVKNESSDKLDKYQILELPK